MTAEDVFRAQAEAEGMGYWEWCRANGILTDDRERRIDRREVNGLDLERDVCE